MSKFSNFKIRCSKSSKNLENGGGLDPSAKTCHTPKRSAEYLNIVSLRMSSDVTSLAICSVTPKAKLLLILGGGLSCKKKSGEWCDLT